MTTTTWAMTTLKMIKTTSSSSFQSWQAPEITNFYRFSRSALNIVKSSATDITNISPSLCQSKEMKPQTNRASIWLKAEWLHLGLTRFRSATKSFLEYQRKRMKRATIGSRTSSNQTNSSKKWGLSCRGNTSLWGWFLAKTRSKSPLGKKKWLRSLFWTQALAISRLQGKRYWSSQGFGSFFLAYQFRIHS